MAPIFHRHFSSLRLREQLKVEKSKTSYFCPSCKREHLPYPTPRIKIIVSDSTLHNWFDPPDHLAAKQVEGDFMHVEYITIPGADIKTLTNAFRLDYIARAHQQPLDVVLVAGYNDLIAGSTKHDIETRYKDFSIAVKNAGPANQNTVVIGDLMYVPKLSWFLDNGPLPVDHQGNIIDKIYWLNQAILSLNLDNGITEYHRLYKYGIRMYTKKYTDQFGQLHHQKIKMHRFEHWREKNPIKMLHLCNEQRCKMATRINKYFVLKTHRSTAEFGVNQSSSDHDTAKVLYQDSHDDDLTVPLADAKLHEELKKEDHKKPSPEVFKHEDLRADFQFEPITLILHNMIVSALQCPQEIVVKHHNIEIKKRDLYTLTANRWINDQIIEVYFAMIAKRSTFQLSVSKPFPRIYSMSTYFFYNLTKRGKGYSAVRKWTKNVDIFSYDLLLIPIHMNRHWSLATIDFRVPGVFHYDSLGVSMTGNAIMSVLLRYLSNEHWDKKGKDMDCSKFAKQSNETPLQENGTDCGVFCCKVAEYLSRDVPLSFSQADIKYFRKRMIYEVLKGKL